MSTTVRLVPSTYAVSNSSYVSVTNPSNAYTNTDSTTYATCTSSRASTTTYYVYFRGFNFSTVPSDAVVESITVKVKGYESSLSTSTNYVPRLCNGTSAISNTSPSTNFGTSSKTITIPTGSLTWDSITGYGSNFGVRVSVRRSNSNTQGYLYVQGIEIEVTYSVPVYHDVSVTNSTGSTVTPTGTTSVLEGDDFTVKCYQSAKPTCTDNNVDVTSQLVQGTEAAYTVDYETRGTYGFALNNSGYYESANKGVDKSCAVCRVSFDLPVSATVTFSYINYAEATYDFGVFGDIDVALSTSYYPAGSGGATISETSYHKACNTSSDNTSSVQTTSYSMSAGEHFIDVKYSKDDGTGSNNDTLQFQVAVELSEQTGGQTYWSYTVTNVVADHTIVFSTAASDALYVKLNGTWTQVARAYVKTNGSWVQTAVNNVFQSGTNYVKG